MKQSSKKAGGDRRAFLRNVAIAGGAATAAVAAGAAVSRTGAQGEAAAPAAADGPTGYHETPHIREYYEKARF